jgi:phosphatidylglycerophosphatase A
MPYLGAFLLFRLFDILKPWPISWADKSVDGGLGILLDDLIAGLFAGVIIYAIFTFI